MSKCLNMSDLAKYPSKCTEYQEIIPSEEQNLKHIAINVNHDKVKQYHVDGDIYTNKDDVLRADFLVLNQKKKTAYIIELKPGKIEKGLEQLFSTKCDFEKCLCDYTIFLRLVYASATHSVMNMPSVIRFRKKNKNLQIKSKILEETI